MKTLVSILNWNNSAATNRCLGGLTSLTSIDVCVIDNNSAEALKIDDGVRKAFGKRLRVILNQQNKGFSGGHNQAAEIALHEDYDYLLLLNNDTEIVDTDFLQKLTNVLSDEPSASLAAPAILSEESASLWYGGGNYQELLAAVRHRNVGVPHKAGAPQETSFATGCCLLVRVADIENLGGLFDDRYFVYWEDADLSARALRRGKKILYVPEATILHRVSSSLGVRSPLYAYYNIRNKLLFMKRNTPPLAWPLAFIHTLYVSLKYVVIALIRQDKKLLRITSVLRAIFDGTVGRYGKVGL